MKTIYKYKVEPDSEEGKPHTILVPMPRGAKPLCVMGQGGSVYVWAEVDTEEDRNEDALFACVGTGFGALPGEGFHYFGSVIQGSYVWHFYVARDRLKG